MTGMTKHGRVVHGVPAVQAKTFGHVAVTFCGIATGLLETRWPNGPFPSGWKTAEEAPDCKRCLRSMSA